MGFVNFAPYTACASNRGVPGCSARHRTIPQHHFFLALRCVAVMVPLVRSHFITSRLLACQCARNRVEEVISQRLGANSFKCESFSITSKSIHHIQLLTLFFLSSSPPFLPRRRHRKGYKMAVPTCKNRLTGADVEESLCNSASRPESTVVQCNTHACPPK